MIGYLIDPPEYLEVPGREADAITRMEHQSLTAMTIRLILLMADGTLEPHVGGIPHLLCMPESLVNCRGLGLAQSPRSQDRLISQDALEGSQPCGGGTK
jgi:hypothetical protein